MLVKVITQMMIEDRDIFGYDDRTASKENCAKRQFSSFEKSLDAYICCYRDAECTISGIKTSMKGCEPLTKDEYEDLDLYVTLLNLSCDKYKIYCSGNTLKKLLYSILILLFIL